MAMEIIPRKPNTLAGKFVSIKPSGTIVFNSLATKCLREHNVRFLLLFFDPETYRFELRDAEEEPAAFKISFSKTGAQASISARALAKRLELSVHGSVPVAVSWEWEQDPGYWRFTGEIPLNQLPQKVSAIVRVARNPGSAGDYARTEITDDDIPF